MSSAARSIDIASRSRLEHQSASSSSARGRVRVLAAADRREQRAVAHEVGVAADRRGEVAVARRAQAGVASVDRVVARLLERAQDERGQRRAAAAGAPHVGVDHARDLPHRVLGLLRRHRLRQRRRRHVERGELLDQALDPQRLRALVDAVERGHLAACRAASRPPRWRRSSGARSAGATRSSRSPASPVTWPSWEKSNSGSTVSTASAPRAWRAASSAAAASRAAYERLRPRRLGLLLAGEDAVDARVVEPRVGADRRAREGAAAQRRALELELDGHRQPVLAGDERAG